MTDPADMGALLLAAVEAHQARTGLSQAEIARLAGIAPPNLHEALDNPNTRPVTVRALCRVLGLRVRLVRVRT